MALDRVFVLFDYEKAFDGTAYMHICLDMLG